MSTLSAYMEQDHYEFPQNNLKVGLWMEGNFDWYEEEDRMSHPEGGLRTLVQRFTEKKISYAKITIKNTTLEKKSPKLFYRYENAIKKDDVAFYIPNEQAILHVAPNSVALLGGMIKGMGIAQYCILGKGGLYQDGCFKSVSEGLLFYSPLAKGEVTSIFTLESDILPSECVEVVSWVIHAETREEAMFLNREIINEM